MTVDRADGLDDPVERTRRELGTVRRAWSVLATGSVPAAESLVHLASNARSELVRVQAATAVLDRVGLGKVEGLVVADVSRAMEPERAVGGSSAAAILASRMRALQAAGGDVEVIRGSLADEVATDAGLEPGGPTEAILGVLGPVSEPTHCPDCGYMPGDGDDPTWCTWCEAPIPDPRDAP